MTPQEARVAQLEQFIYNIDFACRCCVNPADAVRVIQELCTEAHVDAVVWGRKMNEVKT